MRVFLRSVLVYASVPRRVCTPSGGHAYGVKGVANARAGMGVRVGDRVATIAWNGYRHFELYFAISGSGAVLHTINPRLSPEQLGYVINHAEDKVVCVDLTFAKAIAAVLPKLPSVKAVVVLCDKANMPEFDAPNILCYEELIADEKASYAWPSLDERQACSLCYTSGTTGAPKGVLYSHRSTVLHAFSVCTTNSFALGQGDSLLPVVPMFHVNSWGIPYAACMAGCKLVFPGSAMDGKSIAELMAAEHVNMTAGVPTVWQMLLAHLEATNTKLPHLQRVLIGGSACAPSMMEEFERKHNVRVQHAWGMTEMSPTGVVNDKEYGPFLAPAAGEPTPDKLKQGREMYGVELAIFDDAGKMLPRDGKTPGNLRCRGPWTMHSYYKADKSSVDADGWFDTGDMATISKDGYLHITDRAKDLIKTGGEWISSIDLENVALRHPGIAQAAAIAVPSEKWGERPIVVAVKRPAAQVDKAAVLALYQASVPKWSVPDDVIFVKELPVRARVRPIERRQARAYTHKHARTHAHSRTHTHTHASTHVKRGWWLDSACTFEICSIRIGGVCGTYTRGCTEACKTNRLEAPGKSSRSSCGRTLPLGRSNEEVACETVRGSAGKLKRAGGVRESARARLCARAQVSGYCCERV